MKFHEMTAARLAAIQHDQVVVMLPIAAIEQHGPHLPTGTDTILCQAVAADAHAGDWLPDRIDGMFVCRDMRQRTQAGATGRADLASAEKGAALFEAAVSGVERFVQFVFDEPLPG